MCVKTEKNINKGNKTNEMGIDRLKRVICRIEENFPRGKVTAIRELRKAIMYECGTDERTIRRTMDLIKELGWIQREGYTFTIVEDVDK